MKPVWIAVISAATLALQSLLLLITGGTAALFVISLINAIR